MKLNEAIILALKSDDALMAGRVVDILRVKCGYNYERCFKFVSEHTGISRERFESLMEEADAAESRA